MPFDLSKFDPDKIKMAEDLGIPVGQILNWAGSVEARLVAIQKEMPAQIQGAMEAAIEKQREKQMAAMQQMSQQTPQGGGGGYGGIVTEILKEVRGGGGGYDEEMISITKQIMRANLDRMKQDASFTDAIKNAIVSKIAGKAAAAITEVV